MSLGVIGPPGCGKTSVLGLFNQANIIYVQQNDSYRYLFDPDYQGRAANIYEAMVGHRVFPDKTPPGDKEAKFRMMMGVKPDTISRDKVGMLWNKYIRRYEHNGYIHLVGEVFDYPGEELNDYVNYGYEVSENLESIFESNPLTLVIDASRFVYSGEGNDYQDDDEFIYKLMITQDKQLSQFISGLIKYRKTHSTEFDKDMIIIFTKMDNMVPRVKKRYNDKKDMPLRENLDSLVSANQDERNYLGEEFLKDFLPNTYGAIEGSELVGEGFDIDCFYSWVELTGEEGEATEDPLLKRKSIAGGADRVVFPEEIFGDLIDHITEVLRDNPEGIPDPKEKVKELYDKADGNPPGPEDISW